MDANDVRDVPLIDDQPIKGTEGSDLLAMEPFARVLAGVALGTAGPFNIGVYGDWGVGKTSLLAEAKELVAGAKRPGVVAVWFNAWQYEREEHPLFPLIAAIIDAVEKHADQLKTTNERLFGRLARLGSSLRALTRGMKFKADVGLPLVGQVGVEFSAKDALEAEAVIGKQTNPLQAEMLYQSAFQALSDLTDPGQRPAEGEDDTPLKVVVFIDDLDRCLPDQALRLLENIKLVLSQKGFIFVLALDSRIVVSFLAKRYRREYGVTEARKAEQVARTYLHKIVQLQFDIPHHETRFTQYVTSLVQDRLGPDHPVADIVDVLTASADCNPRELVRLLNNLIIDWQLWQALPREGTHGWKQVEVLTAMAISRVLQHSFGAAEARAISRNKSLCEALLAEPGEGKPAADEKRVRGLTEQHGAQTGSLYETVCDNAVVHVLLRKFGSEWLKDEELRQAVTEFYRQSEAAWATPEDQRAIFERVLRRTLNLEEGQAPTKEQLAAVTKLGFSGEEEFGDGGLSLVRGLTSLQRLDLSSTQVDDLGLVHLARLTNLQQLDLSSTRVTAGGLVHLAGLTSLEGLGLSLTQVGDAGLAHLAGLSRLKGLGLNSTQVTDVGLAHLSRLTSLQRLWLRDTHVGDTGLARLAGLTSLQTLDLRDTQVSDDGLEHLAGLIGLESLDLSGTQVTTDGRNALHRKLPKCAIQHDPIVLLPSETQDQP